MKNRKIIIELKRIIKDIKILQGRLKFEKVILWLSIITIIAACFFQGLYYSRSGKLCSFNKIKSKKISGVMYYTGESENMEINNIIEISDIDFSYERRQINTNDSDTWVRVKLDRNNTKDYNLVYSNRSIIEIGAAYINIDGAWSKLNTYNDWLYSYIILPSDYNSDQYLYIKLKNLNTKFCYHLLLNNQQSFFDKQIHLLLFRLINITILLAMLGINLMLYLNAKVNKYIQHSLFLFSLIQVLIQISGLQKIILGFNDYNFGYLWGGITSLTSLCFIYSYLDIMKLNKRFVKMYQFLVIVNLVFVIFLNKMEKDVIIWSFLITVCAVGLLAIILTFIYIKKISKMFLGGVVLLILSIAIFIQGTYGILPWNQLTSNVIYLAASIEAVLFTIGIMREIKSERSVIQKLEIEASTDKLTGLFNRYYFEKNIIPKVREYDRKNGSLSLLILDIDYFKKVNDTFGHNVGDILLSELSNVITASVRKEDYVIRWGGEEFIVILFDTNIYDATVIAEKIREMIEAYEFEYVKNINVSIGVTQKHGSDTVDDWVKKADQALYRAKQSGRNRVVVSYLDILPIKIKWSRVFECNNYQINTEHKELIMIMNHIIEEWSTSNYKEENFLNLYDQLLASTALHFKSEENIISKKEYPYYDIHKQIHQFILQQAVEVKNLMINKSIHPSKVIEFLIEVVVGHMITEDINYYKYI